MRGRLWFIALTMLVTAGCYHGLSEADLSLTPTVWAETNGLTTAGVAPTACEGDGVALTLEDAITRALARDATLSAYDAEVGAARAQIEVPSARDPEIRVGTVRLDRLLDGSPRFGTGVRFRFERPGTLSAESDVAWLDSEVVAAERGEAQLTLIEAVSTLYVAAQVAPHRTRLAASVAALARRRLDRALLAEEKAVGSRVDTAAARLALADHQATAAERAADETATAASLATLVGLPAGCPLRLSEPAAFNASSVSNHTGQSTALVAEAWAHRPALRGALAAVKQAAPRVHIAEIARYPWLEFAQVEYFANNNAEPGRAFGLSVGISIPIFRGSAAVEAAEAEALLQQRRMRQVAQTVAAEVETAVAGLRRAKTAAAGLRAALAEVGDADITRLTADAEAGRIDPDAVMGLAQRRLALESRLVEAEYHVSLAQVALDRAMGRGAGP